MGLIHRAGKPDPFRRPALRTRGAPIGDWLKSSGPGVAAAIAWVAFGLSCLWWPDIGIARIGLDLPAISG